MNFTVDMKNQADRCVSILFDALNAKLVTLHTMIAASRHRLYLIERQYGLSMQQLENALEEEQIALTDQEALVWYEELKNLQSLNQDLQILRSFLIQKNMQPQPHLLHELPRSTRRAHA